MERYQVVFATEIPVGAYYSLTGRPTEAMREFADGKVSRVESQKSTEYFPATSFDDAYRQASAFAEIGSTRIVMIREVGA